MGEYALDRVMVDWVTITTFDSSTADMIAELMNSDAEQGNKRPASRMQYSGTQWDLNDGTYFAGSAIQNDKMHVMFQASGMAAHRFAVAVSNMDARRTVDVNVTRIDVQLTRELPATIGGSHQRELREQHGEKLGRRTLRLVEGGGGYDTLYVGSRKSDIVTRYYVKKLVGGDTVHQRLEIEFKRNAARNVWRTLPDLSFAASVLQGDADALGLAWRISDCVGNVKCRIESTEDGRLNWFRNVVSKFMLREVFSHDGGELAAEIARTCERVVRVYYDRIDTDF